MTELVTHLFIDTNVLHQLWPQLSLKIENVLRSAKILGVEVELPAPVMVELERAWKERTRADLDSAKRILNVFGTLVENSDLKSVLPNWDALEAGYKKAVSVLLDRWSINVIPIAELSISEFFNQANERRTVFEDNGTNFQDAVILQTAVERIRRTQGHGGFLSDDGVFERRRDKCQLHFREFGVSIQAFKLLELESHFNTRLTITEQERIAYHKSLAIKAVRIFLPDLQAHFNKQYTETKRIFAEANMPFARTGELTLDDVMDITVPNLSDQQLKDGPLKVLATVKGTIPTFFNARAEAINLPKIETMELGTVLLAEYDGSGYKVRGVDSMAYGTPGNVGQFTKLENVKLS